MSNFQLTESEQYELSVKLKEVLLRYAISASDWRSVLHEWDKLSKAIENGYEFTIYEYTDDLVIRDILEDLLLILPDNLRHKVYNFIEPVDQRFQDCTAETPHPEISRMSNKQEARWWYWRTPKKIVGELKKDLRM